jgi:hypothetical protein
LYQVNQLYEFSLFFWLNKIRVSPTGIVSSFFSVLPLIRLTLSHHRVVSRFLSIELRWAHCLRSSPPLSSWNRSIKSVLPLQATLPDCPTSTLQCYKKIISTLITLSITQSYLHFTSFIARAPRHRISICQCYSLSLLSHTHRPSAQRHPWWGTSRHYFTSAYEFM